jgi:dienelactone hydrolase
MCALDLARSAPEGLAGVVSFHGLLGAPAKDSGKTITSKVLILHGYDDPMATPDQLLAFAKEMSAAGADWQAHVYGNTVHAFTNPEANMPEHGIKHSPIAESRSWIAMKHFFEEVFG